MSPCSHGKMYVKNHKCSKCGNWVLRREWPHCLAIDFGRTHPTGACMATVSSDGHYFLTEFYEEPELYLYQHANAFLGMVARAQQFDNPYFLCHMCDYRDPQVPAEIIRYTNGRIIPAAPVRPRKIKGIGTTDPKEMAITIATRLLSEDKLHADETSAYFENFRQQWAKLRYKKNSPIPKLIKKDDDVMDPVLQCIIALNPIPDEDLDYKFSETREPPLSWLRARDREREEEFEEEEELV